MGAGVGAVVAGVRAVVAGVSKACDGAVRPVTDGTLVAVPAECKTAGAITAVPDAADFCVGGEPWAWPSWRSSPERQKDWPERAAG